MAEKKILTSSMSALQDMLDAMAAETPSVPESFRASWREALRKESAAAKEQAETPIPDPGAQGPSDRVQTGPAPRQRSWRLGLSVAAAFAFLLGSAMLGWDSVSLTRARNSSAPTAFSVQVAKEDDSSLSDDRGDSALSAGAGPQETEDSSEYDRAFPLMMAARKTEEGAKVSLDQAAGEPVGTMTDRAAEYEEAEDAPMVMEAVAAETAVESAENRAAEYEEAEDAPIVMESFAAETAVESAENRAAEYEEAEDAPMSAEARPLQIAGFVLIGLSLLLAACGLILRTKKRGVSK
ncbi:MAG: hypothetical protein IKE24_00010 [Clostridia bacterium]|nr:hypothetical protein [Clostridia bacterium]